jgi:FKBP-type peptidyl-prolyl cis-trans isomerase
VTLDYEVRLLTGQMIDSSYATGQPLTGTAGQFVPGFSEAVQLMRPGDTWIVWVPPKLGYGDIDVGPIPSNSVLRFKLALHSVTRAG